MKSLTLAPQRHRRRLLAGATLVVALASATPAAMAVSTTLHLTAIVYQNSHRGTVYTSKERVYEDGSRIGSDISVCTEVSGTKFHCTGSYTLTHGTMRFSGTIPLISNTNRLTITGGTGSYKGAHGTVLTEYNRAGTSAKETITF